MPRSSISDLSPLEAGYRLVLHLAVQVDGIEGVERANHMLLEFANARELGPPSAEQLDAFVREMEFEMDPATPLIDLLSILDSFRAAAEAAAMKPAWVRAAFCPNRSPGTERDWSRRVAVARLLTNNLEQQLAELKAELCLHGVIETPPYRH